MNKYSDADIEKYLLDSGLPPDRLIVMELKGCDSLVFVGPDGGEGNVLLDDEEIREQLFAYLRRRGCLVRKLG